MIDTLEPRRLLSVFNRVSGSVAGGSPQTRVWLDANYNGRFDTGEAAVQVDATNRYSISYTGVGSQRLMADNIVPASGKWFTVFTPGEQRTINIAVSGPQLQNTVRGSVNGGSPSTQVWLDTNFNNRFDPGEPTTHVTAAGTYELTYRTTGTQHLMATGITPVGGHWFSVGTLGETRTINLSVTNTVQPNIVRGKVTGGSTFNRIYIDRNANGTFDPTEPFTTPAADGSYSLSFTGIGGVRLFADGLISPSDGIWFTVGQAGEVRTINLTLASIEARLTSLTRFANPYNYNAVPGGLISDSAGNFYGVAGFGGLNVTSSNPGYGIIYKVSPNGTRTTLFQFNGTNGRFPSGRLLRDAAGNLYGTTQLGGNFNKGTVFKLSPSGVLTTLVHFNGANGNAPMAGLTLDSAGNLYGTTLWGGSADRGTLFKLTPGGTLTTLVTFNDANGALPMAELTRDASGNFYGTTRTGVVFKLTPSGQFSMLAQVPGGLEIQGSVFVDRDGTIYGAAGGTYYYQFGSLFKITANGAFSTLYSFSGDVGNPIGGVIVDAAGNLFGSTIRNGGSVFRLSRDGVYTTLYTFGEPIGNAPQVTLIADAGGNLYGTLPSGRTHGGMVFKLEGTGFVTSN